MRSCLASGSSQRPQGICFRGHAPGSSILICLPDVSLLCPTPLTPPSLQHRHVHACSLISLNGCLSPLPPCLPSSWAPKQMWVLRCGFQGLCSLLLPLSRNKAPAGSWAQLQSQGHCTVLPHCHPPFDLLQCVQIQHLRLNSPLREQRESWIMLWDLWSDLINIGWFYYGFHNYKMLTLGNFEMMMRYCRGYKKVMLFLPPSKFI